MRRHGMLWLVIVAVMGGETASASECEVQLAITLPSEVSPTREGYVNPDEIRVTLTNVGRRTVTLVHPGDGSMGKRRTPAVAWLVDGQVNGIDVGFCGNINALKPGEVFDLPPGASVKLTEWIPLYLKDAGTHEVRLTYRNDPTMEMNGVPLGRHDPDTLQRLRRSTPCALESNTASIRVRAAAP